MMDKKKIKIDEAESEISFSPHTFYVLVKTGTYNAANVASRKYSPTEMGSRLQSLASSFFSYSTPPDFQTCSL